MEKTYRLYRFGEIDAPLLYAILHLREKVFVVEQNAVYTDIDHLDQQSLHLCLFAGMELAGYTRLLPPGAKFQEASIGRIVLEQSHRGGGAGRELVNRSLQAVREHFGPVSIRIEAQQHLRKFYESLGFAAASESYDWGGIPHLKMLACAA